MILTLTPTKQMRKVNGTDVREWHGTDEEGVQVVAMIAAVAPQTNNEQTHDRYTKDLNELGYARRTAFDLRQVL